jgi:hypothetical protein
MAAVLANTSVDTIVLISAIGPVIVTLIICWVFFRAARRNDQREAREARQRTQSPHE